MKLQKDWHPETVKAAIRKRGVTLTYLAVTSGYSESAVRKALRRHWPAIEGIVATFLGERPETIWPSRYDSRGRPLNRRRNKRNGGVTESHRQIGGVA